MKQTEHITQHELEQLVEAYFDCRLSRAEEADLRRVLAYSPYTSPAIESARAEMGAEVALKRQLMRRQARRRAPWLNIAAAVAVTAVIGTVALLHYPGAPTPEISVYCNGQPVADSDKALQLAKAEIAESERFMKEMILAERMQLQAAEALAEAQYYSDLHNLQ